MFADLTNIVKYHKRLNVPNQSHVKAFLPGGLELAFQSTISTICISDFQFHFHS